MSTSKRLNLNFKEKLKHYTPALLLYGITVIMLVYTLWTHFFTDNSQSVRTLGEMLGVYFYFALAATFISYLKYRKLRFKKTPISITPAEFEEAWLRTARDREWSLTKQEGNLYQFDVIPKLSLRKDLLITIILEKNFILFNAIGSLKTRSTISTGLINKDRTIFLTHLKQVLRQEEYTKTPEFNDTQWNWKMILARIFLYPFCLFLIWVSIFHLIPAGNYFLPIICIVFALAYILSDLYMIFKGGNAATTEE